MFSEIRCTVSRCVTFKQKKILKLQTDVLRERMALREAHRHRTGLGRTHDLKLMNVFSNVPGVNFNIAYDLNAKLRGCLHHLACQSEMRCRLILMY